MWQLLRTSLWTLKIALPKVAVGWMFALLTIDFNRVAVVELGVAAVIVTGLLSIHYFLAPFQVVAGWLADRKPLFGYRRTPYLIAANLLACILFPLIPSAAFGMGEGLPLAYVGAVALFVVFGMCIATIADSYHALIAEVTTPTSRPIVISVVWVIMILSTILSAVVMNAVRPEFSPEGMQTLYNLTPWVVMTSVLLGLVGVEKRQNATQIETDVRRASQSQDAGAPRRASSDNPLRIAATKLREERQSRLFFAFVCAAIFGIFLQESLIEVLGAELFAMSISETTKLQPMWGGGILIGMIVMGALSSLLKLPREKITALGCVGVAVGFFCLAATAYFQARASLIPCLVFLGLSAGVFNVGALALMMDMTTRRETGMYMGLWGTAQAMGMGLSAAVAGALHTAFIGSGLLAPQLAYAGIFVLEGMLLAVAVALLRQVDVRAFQQQRSSVTAIDESDAGVGQAQLALGAGGA
ncbi:MAG: BCD family MFS transporter [Pseudomonadota bacterium]